MQKYLACSTDEANERYAPFLEYLDLTAKINRTQWKKRKKRLIEKRNPLLEKVISLFSDDLNHYVNVKGKMNIPTAFVLDTPDSYITVSEPHSKTIVESYSLGEYLSKKEKKKLEKEWEQKGYVADVWDPSGLSGNPFHVSDTTTDPFFFIKILAHEALHNFHFRAYAQNIRAKGLDAKIFSENAAEVFGDRFASQYLVHLPKDSHLWKRIHAHYKVNTAHRKTKQRRYARICELIDNGDKDKIESFLKRISDNDGETKTLPQVLLYGTYSGDKKAYSGLQKIYGSSLNGALYGHLSGSVMSHHELTTLQSRVATLKKHTVPELFHMFDFSYKKVVGALGRRGGYKERITSAKPHMSESFMVTNALLTKKLSQHDHTELSRYGRLMNSLTHSLQHTPVAKFRNSKEYDIIGAGWNLHAVIQHVLNE